MNSYCAPSLLDSALQYADRGWPVFPLHHCHDGACSCQRRCQSPGKHPRTEHGFKNATINEQTIRGWWSRWPQGVTIIEAREHHDIMAPAPRVFELRHDNGKNIATIYTQAVNAQGNRHTNARYVLMPGEWKDDSGKQ